MGARQIVAVVVLLLALPGAALSKAGSWDGNDFLQYCVSSSPDSKPKSQDENDRIVYCLGYVEGVIQIIGNALEGQVCPPRDATPAAVLEATARYLRATPARKGDPLALSMITAAKAKWPCK